MKYMKVMIVLMVLLWCAGAFAGDLYNTDVKVEMGKSYVIYYGTVDTVNTDNSYTQWMNISGMNHDASYIWAVCSNVAGTEDVNVLVEYSMDRTNAVATTLNSGALDDMDQLSTTTKYDTISTIGGAACPVYKAKPKWFRVKFDGQSGNGATTISWWCVFRKDTPYHSPLRDKEVDFHRDWNTANKY